jgi:transposase
MIDQPTLSIPDPLPEVQKEKCKDAESPAEQGIRSSFVLKNNLLKNPLDLTDEQWLAVAPLLPPSLPSKRGRPACDTRLVVNGILWKLRTGQSWENLPLAYPSHQSCYRYFRLWRRNGLLDAVLDKLSAHLRENGSFELSDALWCGKIHLVTVGYKVRVEIASMYPHTWQASTAWLFLSLYVSRFNQTWRSKRLPIGERELSLLTAVLARMERKILD